MSRATSATRSRHGARTGSSARWTRCSPGSAEYAQAGVQRVLLQHLVHDDLEMLELIGAEILPAAASL